MVAKKKYVIVGLVSAGLVVAFLLFMNVALDRIAKMQEFESVEHEILLLNEWLISRNEISVPQTIPSSVQMSGIEHNLEHTSLIEYDKDSGQFVRKKSLD